jgi:endonuclease/exonuclease/phosphatase family metal-dependent hydrolase
MRGWGLLASILWVSVSWGAKDYTPQSDICKNALLGSAPKKLRIVTFNTQNLHINIEIDKMKGYVPADSNDNTHHYPKTPKQIDRLAEIIKTTNPDIAVLQEVDSINELLYLNSNYFNDQYDVVLKNGNDKRGFEIGFLVKKGIGINFEFESHVDMKWVDPETNRKLALFSRDAPALVIRRDGEKNPLLVVIGHHAKSKAGNKRDFEGRRLRTAQHDALHDLVKKYQSRFGPNTPVIVAGDYNTDIHAAEETKKLRTVMTDAFDLQPRKMTEDERVTHTTFIDNPKGDYHQLDGILISTGARVKVLEAAVRRDTKRLATTFDERDRQISDHFLVYADIEIE